MRQAAASPRPAAAAQAAAKGGKGGLEWVTNELSWHRTQARRAMVATVIALVALIISVGINGVLLSFRPGPVYFMTSPDGRLVQLTPLDRPVMSQAAMLNWVSGTVAQTLSVDFLNYRSQLMAVQDNYTDAAYNQLISSLIKSGNLGMIKSQRLSVSATVAQAPVVIAHGDIGKTEAWKIQFPVTVSYESSGGVGNTQSLLATALVERVPQTQFPRGLAIAQLVLAQHN